MRIWILAASLAAAAGLGAWVLWPRAATPPSRLEGPKPPPVVGGADEERAAIERGLDWLASAQEPDGHWCCARWSTYKKNPPAIPAVDGSTVDVLDPALTGLALLPFLYDGQTATKGTYASTVSRALEYLKLLSVSYTEQGLPHEAGQQPGFWHWGAIAGEYNVVVVHAALAEALLRTGDRDLQPLVEAGVRQMVDELRTDRPWATTLNPYDMGAVAFWVELLETADACGVEVPARARPDAKKYLAEMTEATTGRILTNDVCKECLGGWDSQSTAILMRGWLDPGPDALREKEVDTIAGHAPHWETRWKLPEDPSKGVTEFYKVPRDIVNYFYWYYGTLAMERYGGKRSAAWRTALVGVLLPNQVASGDLAGSWDPVDPWGSLAGRVYSTAYAVMALQVPSLGAPSLKRR